jgi:hypothetical protein
MQHGKLVSVLLGIAALALATTVGFAASYQTAKPQAAAPKSQAPSPKPPMKVRVPPLPNVGFAPVRPMDVVRATYDFAANHPEILHYIPCFCGCGEQGHKANESCFVARRDKAGNVLEWDTHGFGCTICIDVAREAMQLYASGADVRSIRTAIEKRYADRAAERTPTPPPPPAPAKKS